MRFRVSQCAACFPEHPKALKLDNDFIDIFKVTL